MQKSFQLGSSGAGGVFMQRRRLIRITAMNAQTGYKERANRQGTGVTGGGKKKRKGKD